MKPRIGIDFDNTIVCYDKVFHRLAVQSGLIPLDTPRSKNAVRDTLRREGFEDVWTRLQGQVYGSCILAAHPFSGVAHFLEFCHKAQMNVFIVSHKTRFAASGTKYDLHQAALNWLSHYHFFERGLVQLCNVFFEPTRKAKLRRVREIDCSHFIDDLPECLTAPEFPDGTQRCLFDPNEYVKQSEFERFSSWSELQEYFHACVSI